MTAIFSSFSTIWRLAAPYFYSEDRWPGRLLLAAVIAVELSLVGITVLLTYWQNSFYNALQGRDWDVFVNQLIYWCFLATCATVLQVYKLYLNQWLQIRWRRWMTRQYLNSWLDEFDPLPHAIARQHRRQPGPAHRRRHSDVHRALVDHRRRPDERDRDALVVHRHPLDAVERRAVRNLRLQRHGDSRLPGVGGADLRHRRNRVHPLGRLAAGAAQLRPPALRGRLPFQPDPGAGELRADRHAERRKDRIQPAVPPVRQSRRQLVPDHVAAEEADVLHHRLTPRHRSCSRSSWSARPTSRA